MNFDLCHYIFFGFKTVFFGGGGGGRELQSCCFVPDMSLLVGLDLRTEENCFPDWWIISASNEDKRESSGGRRTSS